MPKKVIDIVAHFFTKVDKQGQDGCWLWKGGLKANGYGQFYIDRYPVYAHRWSYEFHKGPIPEGLNIDHLCRNTRCVNPNHLEAVEQAINVQRNKSATKTLCAQGHPYNEENTYIDPTTGRRKCRACNKRRLRENYISFPHPNRMKTYCKRGHPFNEENTITYRGKRRCRICAQLYHRNYYMGIHEEKKMQCPYGHPYNAENTYFQENGSKTCRICSRSKKRYTTKDIQNPNAFTKSRWLEIKAQYNFTCLCCGKQEPEIKLTADHVIPLALGGTKTIGNIQPLCSTCNFKKGAKSIDFRPQNP